MNRRISHVFLALSLLTLSVTAPPLVAKMPTEQLPKLIITGYSTPKPIDQLGYVVRVIDRKEIDALPAADLSDVLNQSANLSMSKTGGLSSIFLKGFASNQYKIYLDGIQIKDASSTQGTPALDMIPISTIDRIEILSGQGSTQHGSDAMGGVIQLFSKKATDGLEGEFSQSIAGDYSNTSFFVGAGLPDLSVNIAYGREFDNRISALRDGAEKDVSKRENLSFDLTKRDVDYDTGFTVGYFTGFNEYDNNVNTVNLAAVSDTEDNSVGLENFQWQTFFTLKHSQDFQTRLQYSESDLRRDHTSAFGPFFYEGGLQDFSVDSFQKWNRDVETSVGYSHKRETIDGTYVATRRTKSSDAVFAQAEWLNPILSLRVGGRSESFETDNTDTYSVSVFRKVPVLGTLMYTKRTGYREPSLFEITTSENILLEAETSEVEEIGFLKQVGNISFGITFFDNTVHDKIEFNDGNFTYFNQTGKSFSKGNDTSLSIRNLGWLDHLSFNFTETTAKQADGTPLQKVPNSKFTASTSTSWDQFVASFSAETVGRRYDFNDIGLHGYTVYHAKLAYKLSETQTIDFTIENLLDTDYEELFGYETPGRTLFCRYTQSF